MLIKPVQANGLFGIDASASELFGYDLALLEAGHACHVVHQLSDFNAVLVGLLDSTDRPLALDVFLPGLHAAIMTLFIDCLDGHIATGVEVSPELALFHMHF